MSRYTVLTRDTETDAHLAARGVLRTYFGDERTYNTGVVAHEETAERADDGRFFAAVHVQRGERSWVAIFLVHVQNDCYCVAFSDGDKWISFLSGEPLQGADVPPVPVAQATAAA